VIGSTSATISLNERQDLRELRLHRDAVLHHFTAGQDLAKRFYMLLYIFVTRRYRHVEIIFIRHTDRAEEVDEETFFHSPATGGTLVSSALEAMQRIIATRYRPADWNIYAAQASDGDNAHSDRKRAGQLIKDAILPVTQYFAYMI
jgi:uncharacterized sporulation protein YeaH/YhbH (DUF444 family)